jgi:hypothetical protein
MDPQPAASQLFSNKFQIVEGGSTKKSNILIDGSGLNFSYGVKRKNQAGVTWRCNFRELKGEESMYCVCKISKWTIYRRASCALPLG